MQLFGCIARRYGSSEHVQRSKQSRSRTNRIRQVGATRFLLQLDAFQYCFGAEPGAGGGFLRFRSRGEAGDTDSGSGNSNSFLHCKGSTCGEGDGEDPRRRRSGGSRKNTTSFFKKPKKKIGGADPVIAEVGGSCPTGHRPMYRSECAAGPTVRGKRYHMHGEGCQAKWWPNTGCFLSRNKLYFSTCGQGRPQSTKHSLGICLPLGTTSIRPIVNGHGKYVQNWHSLDSRPLPGWFDDAKFGIFIHWGVYAVPAIGTHSEWYEYALKPENALYRQANGRTTLPAVHAQRYGAGFPYKGFAKMFKAKKFDAKRWAELFHAAGAKYVVLTSKHHDGFCLYPSKYCKWNSKVTGPKKDIIGELAAATRAKNLTFGVYHSLYEWFHPLYLQDKNKQFRTNNFARKKTIPELRELVHRYKPSVIWSDGEWEAPPTYWTSKKFLAWLYNVSPVKDEVVVNDRWGGPNPPLPGGTRMRHGDFFSGADEQAASASMMRHKWESAMMMDPTSWGFDKTSPPQNYPSGRHWIAFLVKTVAYGGNLLLNVGPSATGIIPAVFQKRLKVIGAYLRINGEGIYQTRACWEAQEERHIEGFYTAKPDEKVAYLHVVPKSGRWPRPGSVLHLTGVRSAETVQLLTADGPVDVDCKTPRGVAHVHCKTPSRHGRKHAVHWNGFALKLTGVAMQMNWNR